MGKGEILKQPQFPALPRKSKVFYKHKLHRTHCPISIRAVVAKTSSSKKEHDTKGFLLHQAPHLGFQGTEEADESLMLNIPIPDKPMEDLLEGSADSLGLK